MMLLSMSIKTCMLWIKIIIAYKDIHQVSILLNKIIITILCTGSNIGVTVAGFSLGSGSSQSELYYPSAIFVTPNQTMFIVDTYNFRVLRWQVGDTLGYTICGGHGQGSAFTQMGYSYGIFVDDQYNVYLSEQTNHRVTIWFVGNTTSGQLVIAF